MTADQTASWTPLLFREVTGVPFDEDGDLVAKDLAYATTAVENAKRWAERGLIPFQEAQLRDARNAIARIDQILAKHTGAALAVAPTDS
ncbi:hypothetical protein ACXET9_07075 [Brachybacterium sp. DNPG3]